ncbi:MAG: helix-turn-helix domain-containing protein [Candidatus Aenigmarchaeota archaeon]|nr:helix-turn-helix domain-containing protein [Candidatus Aenigmarchaeota archaeon]
MINKEQVLREYGLSDNEVKVYLASLKIGNAKANEIAKKAGMLRTTTYEILQTLSERGLVSHVIKSGVRYYEATDPHKLIRMLEERKDNLKLVLPELEALRKSVKEKPSFQMYEGKSGLKTILDDIIKSNPNEILQLNSAKIFETLHYYFPRWIKRRVSHKISTRILQERTKFIVKYKKKDKSELREIRFLPEDFKINTANFIYKNKIAFLTMKEEEIIGIVIQNKEMVDTQRSVFERLWVSFR